MIMEYLETILYVACAIVYLTIIAMLLRDKSNFK